MASDAAAVSGSKDEPEPAINSPERVDSVSGQSSFPLQIRIAADCGTHLPARKCTHSFAQHSLLPLSASCGAPTN